MYLNTRKVTNENIESSESKYNQLVQRLNEFKAVTSDKRNVSVVEAELNTLEDKLLKIGNRLTEALESKNEIENYLKLVSKKKALEEDLQKLLQNFDASGLSKLPERQRKLENTKELLLENKLTKKRLEEVETALKQVGEQLSTATVKLAKEYNKNELIVLEQELSDLEIEGKTLANNLELKKSIVEHIEQNDCLKHTDDSFKCVNCGLNLRASENTLTQESIKELEKILAKTRTKYTQKREEVESFRSGRDDLNKYLNTIVGKKAGLEKERKELQAKVHVFDEEFTVESITKELKSIHQRLTTAEKVDTLQEELEELKKELEQNTYNGKDTSSIIVPDIKNIKLEQAETTDKKNILKSELDEIRSVEQERQKLETELDTTNTALKEYKDKLTKQTVPNLYHKLVEELDSDNLELLLSEVSSRQELRKKSVVEKATCENRILNLDKSLTQTNKKIEENRIKFLKANKLKRVRELLSKNGLPRVYLNKTFLHVVGVTQHYLSVIQADFAVKMDTEKELSFLFKQYGNTSDTWLPATKLSGGQKIRLSLAFLLAINHIVLTDLNFLVLDEPSTHLDDEGKQSLRDIIENLVQKSKGSERQIIVVDHAKELDSAFNSKLTLN